MNETLSAKALAGRADLPSSMSPGHALAAFAATVQLKAIPAAVLERTEDLMIDWLGSALAGKGARGR
ncbi:MAG: hypothetical protein ABJA83_11290, partial [Burkholderiaceae bacterium]